MAQIHDMRCQHYDSIDFDFYRAQAIALRSQARRGMFKFKETYGFIIATLATALVLALIPAMTALYPDKNLEKVAREVTPLFEAMLGEVSK